MKHSIYLGTVILFVAGLTFLIPSSSFADSTAILSLEGLFVEPTQNNHFRCISYPGYGNKTLDSIVGTLSYAGLQQNQGQFSETLINVFLTKLNYSSPDASPKSNLVSYYDCLIPSGPMLSFSNLGNDNSIIQIAKMNIKTSNGQGQNLYYSISPGVVIPPKYYITILIQDYTNIPLNQVDDSEANFIMLYH